MPRLRAFGLVLASGLALAACAPPDGAEPDRRASGALLGAAAGAAAGNLIRGDSRGTLTGALVGGLAGAAIGNQLDRQAFELRQALAGSGAGVTNAGGQLTVSLPEAITFATGSAELRADVRDELAVVARSLLDYPTTVVEVAGHTDDTGSRDYNQRLSERRAASVAAVLTGAGVPAWRVRTRGYAFDRPVASNATDSGRAANRRVEIVISPQA